VSEIGDAENISKSYVSRILRLALLALDIVEAILAGRGHQGMILEKLERPLPASWEGAAPAFLLSAFFQQSGLRAPAAGRRGFRAQRSKPARHAR
jgi:hypothetical protein